MATYMDALDGKHTSDETMATGSSSRSRKIQTAPATVIVYNGDASQKGVAKAAGYSCQMEGCTGKRLAVKWPDGSVTRPCTKGMFTRPDGSWQIG